MHFPFRVIVATRPSSSFSSTAASARGIASPRVTVALASVFQIRWAKRRRSRLKRTISPVESSSRSVRSNSSVSPGQIVGYMLQPVTRRRKRPEDRKTSAASSHFRACVGSRGSSVDVMRRFVRAGTRYWLRFFRTPMQWSQKPARVGKMVSRKAFSRQNRAIVRTWNHSFSYKDLSTLKLAEKPAPRRPPYRQFRTADYPECRSIPEKRQPELMGRRRCPR